jgi:hypothetical protein
MTNAIDRFISEVKADRDLGPHYAPVAIALRALDIEADGNPDATMCFEAVHWIITQQRCSLDERVKALHRLLALPRGPTKVNLRRDGEHIIVKEL